MSLGLAARLALVLAVLVAATSAMTTVAGVVSTTGEVNDDLDQFLKERAEEIVTGERSGPDGRNDRGGGNGRPGNDQDDNDQDGDEATRGDDTPDGTADATVALDDNALQAAVEADSVVQSLDASGQITSSVGGGLPVDETDIALAASDGPSVIRTITVDGADYRMITRHIEAGGAIQVARDLSSTNQLLDGIRNRMVAIGIILSVLAAGAGWLLARSTTNPLRRLTKSVEAVAETGDLSLSVGSHRSDEIGRLADEFDRMLQALNTSRQQQHRLVQDAAHELRTPLTSIHANVELLSRATDLDPGARNDIFASVRSELRQLNVLFTEIIELATDARDTTDHQQVDLAAVAEAAVRAFEARSSVPVDLRVERSPVTGDAAGLERAVSNLLGNAEKYGPAAGSIVVEVGNGTVAVMDRGPGIPAAERDRVFDRFYRTDDARSKPGSGLGLAIVKKIVEDHRGRAWVDDAPSGGTVAGFTLPTAVASAQRSASSDETRR